MIHVSKYLEYPGPSMDNRSMGQGRDFTLILTDKCITVKPLYNGHVEDKRVAIVKRWPL